MLWKLWYGCCINTINNKSEEIVLTKGLLLKQEEMQS